MHNDLSMDQQDVQTPPESKLMRLLQMYERRLEKNPVLTKAATSAVLAGCGDVVSQLVVQIGKAGKKHYSWRSTAAFATFSFVVTGPITHYMYQLLERTVAKHSQFSFIKKVIIDRLLFAPPYLLVMFYAVAIMEGKSHREAWQKVKAVYWPALVRNLVVWGIAQYINMGYVPYKYRVLFGNLVAFVWNIYLAIVRR